MLPLVALVFLLLTLQVSLSSAAASDNDNINYKALFGPSPRQDLTFPQLVKYDGYGVEEHTVITRDGYILSLYRLPSNSSCKAYDNRVPILFMHGLYLSGDDCIIPGPGKSHCYIYADACYDVWVPNVRGNRYSRKHVSLDPVKDSKFWDFAVDEMALVDLPAFIDYILVQTGKEQLTFVGHSQGVGMLLLLCAKKPEYNGKIKVGFGLSVTAWLKHARFLAISAQSLLANFLESAPGKSNFEILAQGGLVQKTGKLLCGLSDLEYPFCSVLVFALLGYNRFQITNETLQVVTGHTPAGTSLKNFIRWGQMKSNGFSEYDYGIYQNLITYKSIKPPLFNLSPITMKWYFISSYNDYVGDVRDIAILKSKLSDVTECILPDKTFGHLDFIYGKDIPNYITPKILSVLDSGPFECN